MFGIQTETYTYIFKVKIPGLIVRLSLHITSTNIELELRSSMHIWGHKKRGTDRQTHRGVYRVAPQLKKNRGTSFSDIC